MRRDLIAYLVAATFLTGCPPSAPALGPRPNLAAVEGIVRAERRWRLPSSHARRTPAEVELAPELARARLLTRTIDLAHRLTDQDVKALTRRLREADPSDLPPILAIVRLLSTAGESPEQLLAHLAHIEGQTWRELVDEAVGEGAALRQLTAGAS